MALAKNATIIPSAAAWVAVLDENLTKSVHMDLTDAYSASLALYLAPTEAVASSGATIRIEVCYATTGIWTPYQSFTSQSFTPKTDAISTGGVSATDTDIGLDDANFSVGDYALIYESTYIAGSEIIQLISDGTAYVFNLADQIIASHAATIPVFEVKNQWVIELPDSANWVRVIVDNLTGGCNMLLKSHIMKIQSV